MQIVMNKISVEILFLMFQYVKSANIQSFIFISVTAINLSWLWFLVIQDTSFCLIENKNSFENSNI